MIIQYWIKDGTSVITTDRIDVHPDSNSYDIAVDVINEVRRELKDHSSFYNGHNITAIEWEEH